MRKRYLDKNARAAVYVHIDRLMHNLDCMKEILPGRTKIMAVLKANGYGHGASAIAHALEGVDFIWGYALATAEEAIALRDAGIRKPLMILGYTFEYAYESLIDREIRMAIFRDDTIASLGRAAERVGKSALVHIAVDTGMSRIGIAPNEAGADFVRRVWQARGIEAEGLFTHFARADEEDLSSANAQAEVFEDFANKLSEDGVDIPLVHCDNSAAMLTLRHGAKPLARAGITMYGLLPSDELADRATWLMPVMEFKSHVVFVKDISPGTPVSYGGTWVAKRTTRVATIPVGYADGYPRSLSGKGCVLIRGKRARIIGRVCMDQMMVDVTDIPDVREEDDVTLIGRDGGEEITADELGRLGGRFNYELVCDISERVPRVVV